MPAAAAVSFPSVESVAPLAARRWVTRMSSWRVPLMRPLAVAMVVAWTLAAPPALIVPPSLLKAPACRVALPPAISLPAVLSSAWTAVLMVRSRCVWIVPPLLSRRP